LGSTGGRYRFEEAVKLAALALQRTGAVHLRVLTLSDPHVITAQADALGLPRDAWSLARVPHSQIPKELGEQDAGLFFIGRGLSEHGCSPTKMGEYWAAGLPVVATADVSDSAEIIRRERVGVLVGAPPSTREELERALSELLDLLEDPELRGRCRWAAEKYYALEPVCDRQVALYQRIVHRGATTPAPSPEGVDAGPGIPRV
jgi:glycosyltransferase involved in cell wall biosynthesis